MQEAVLSLSQRKKIYAGNKKSEQVKPGLQILSVWNQKGQFFLDSAHFLMVTKAPTAPFEPCPFPLGTEEAGQPHPPRSCLMSVGWVHLGAQSKASWHQTLVPPSLSHQSP